MKSMPISAKLRCTTTHFFDGQQVMIFVKQKKGFIKGIIKTNLIDDHLIKEVATSSKSFLLIDHDPLVLTIDEYNYFIDKPKEFFFWLSISMNPMLDRERKIDYKDVYDAIKIASTKVPV